MFELSLATARLDAMIRHGQKADTARGVYEMEKYRQAQLALALNGIGALLLIFPFQATSTNLLLVTDAATDQAAFCIGNRAVFGMRGGATIMGYKCPTGLNVSRRQL
jgi:hypothetical protein